MSLFLAPDENRVWFYLNLSTPSQRSTQSGFMSMLSDRKLKLKNNKIQDCPHSERPECFY